MESGLARAKCSEKQFVIDSRSLGSGAKAYLLILIAISLSFSVVLNAQQEAMNAQFILNTMVMNPGYTGYKEVQSITLDHRSQWVGFEGAPITNSLGFDMALPKNKELAIGGMFMHDKVGPTSELSLSANVAYRFQVSRSSFMSIGLKGHGGLFQARFTSLDLTSDIWGQEDVNFSYDPSNHFMLNFGLGAYYHSQDFFLGLSSPRLLKNRIENGDFNIYNTVRGRTEPTYYLMGGYNFLMTAWTEFQPAFIVKATQGAPLSIGLYGSFILKEKWRVGGFYAINETAGALVQLGVTDRLTVGYSFDVAPNTLISTNLGSHEISATYEFKKFRKRIVYPRRF
ncbi:MAG: type IX secretion system membrane protein PorP/SprF [Flavobacteriales bacterium]|nr:type IX secretion system membrane protein PorP/SprF [Flavobacteriales bacterium]